MAQKTHHDAIAVPHTVPAFLDNVLTGVAGREGGGFLLAAAGGAPHQRDGTEAGLTTLRNGNHHHTAN